MSIPFKNHFLLFHHQQPHNANNNNNDANAKFDDGTNDQCRQNMNTAIMMNNSKKCHTVVAPSAVQHQHAPQLPSFMPLLLLCTAVFMCSAVHVTCAMPLQMLLMYTPTSSSSSSEGPDDYDRLLFPIQQSRLHSALINSRKALPLPLMTNAFLPSSSDESTTSSNSNNNNPYTLMMMKRISSPYAAAAASSSSLGGDTAENEERPADEQKAFRQEQENLLRAGRNILEQNTAPKMYARHIGDLGGTMFRFG